MCEKDVLGSECFACASTHPPISFMMSDEERGSPLLDKTPCWIVISFFEEARLDYNKFTQQTRCDVADSLLKVIVSQTKMSWWLKLG
jgi:hypothetical protein